MSGIRVVRLKCGHERYAPIDWNGRDAMTCAECVGYDRATPPPLRDVSSATPDIEAMSSEERKSFMRELRTAAGLREDTQ